MIEEAKVVRLPGRSGDGYNYGGGLLLVVGDRAIHIADVDPMRGYLAEDIDFAARLAVAWNEYSAAIKRDEHG